MKLHRLTILFLTLSLATTNGFSQDPAAGGAGNGTGSTVIRTSSSSLGTGVGTTGGMAGGMAASGAGFGMIGVPMAIGVAASSMALTISNSNNSQTPTVSTVGNTIASAKTNVCSVTVDKGVTTVAALSGNISYTDDKGKVTQIEIGTGLAIQNGKSQGAQPLADIIAAEKKNGTYGQPNSVSAGLTKALKTVAGDLDTYGTDAGVVMAAIIKTTVKADPSVAADFAKISIEAIAKNEKLTLEQQKAAIFAVGLASLAGASDKSSQLTQMEVIIDALNKNNQYLGLTANEWADFVSEIKVAANGDGSTAPRFSGNTITTYDIDLVSPDRP